MKFYNDIIRSGDSFQEKIGPPEEFEASLGKIVEGYAFLERTLSNVIILLSGVADDEGEIITAELSFRNKINIFSSLFRLRIGVYREVDCEIEVRFLELLTLCEKAAELRNGIIHADCVANGYRVKTTAKSRRGLLKHKEAIDADHVLDIADFIVDAAMNVEQFPMHLGLADTVGGGSSYIAYKKGGRTIRKFELW